MLHRDHQTFIESNNTNLKTQRGIKHLKQNSDSIALFMHLCGVRMGLMHLTLE